MKRFLTILAVALLGLSPLRAQQSAQADYRFGTYLLGKGLLRDATTLTSSFNPELYAPTALDTLNYLRGWTLYHTQQFTPAAEAFGLVGSESSFYPKSALFGTICHLEAGNIEGAKSGLEQFARSAAAEPYGELVAFERGGIALLEGNRELYGRLRQQTTPTNPILTPEWAQLDKVALGPNREPKAWVAGLASAVVPGLGQIYVGNVGEGVASFLMVGAFTALAIDGYNKAGTAKNWRTITYGTVASLLHIGNICGSVASVRVYYEHIEALNKQAIMYSLHIPLREIFE